MPAETTPAETTTSDDPESVGSTAVPAEAVAPLIRGIAVLRELTEADGRLSPSGLERATGLARSTVDRITATLARMGYVRLDGRDAVLAPVSWSWATPTSRPCACQPCWTPAPTNWPTNWTSRCPWPSPTETASASSTRRPAAARCP